MKRSNTIGKLCLFAVAASCASATFANSTVYYNPDFDTFTVGNLSGQGGWVVSGGTSTATPPGNNAKFEIVEIDFGSRNGQKALMIQRPGQVSQPAAYNSFLAFNDALKTPFEFSFDMAFDNQTNYGRAVVRMALPGSSSWGVSLGIEAVDGTYRLIAYDNAISSDGRVILSNGSAPAPVVTMQEFYTFRGQIDPTTGLYSVSVYSGTSIIAVAEDLSIARNSDMAGFSRFTVDFIGGGGASGDKVYIDNIIIADSLPPIPEPGHAALLIGVAFGLWAVCARRMKRRAA